MKLDRQCSVPVQQKLYIQYGRRQRDGTSSTRFVAIAAPERRQPSASLPMLVSAACCVETCELLDFQSLGIVLPRIRLGCAVCLSVPMFGIMVAACVWYPKRSTVTLFTTAPSHFLPSERLWIRSHDAISPPAQTIPHGTRETRLARKDL
jgi:hypothetical protein